ncbi:MAG: helicase, partial [Actinomycetota bacterium]|nr:helicase [Actinomycetota bacterium]
LGRVAPGANWGELRDAAARVAWNLRSLFNLPEATNLLRSMADEGTPYWKSVLRYSVSGCLQAVLDEYAHILPEQQGLLASTPEAVAAGVSRTMCDSLGMQASSMSVDHFRVDGEANRIVPGDGASMRGKFALRFGAEKTDDGSERTRTNQVREAFNSPFWPFVVATTSVGQEGLDFHTYCHAIVHWNLPSNPVDLEQREGRVHRYKNHAVRKNLAAHYELSATSRDAAADPWQDLFSVARSDRDEGATDMVPFWIYTREGGAKIERHVPALPLSRDRDRLSTLLRSLAAYRMVFGQARQEDLVSYLLARFTDEEVATHAATLRIDLQPPRNGGGP